MSPRSLLTHTRRSERVPATENTEWCWTFDTTSSLSYAFSGWFCTTWNRYRDDRFSADCTISTPVAHTFWCMSWGPLRAVGCKRSHEALNKAGNKTQHVTLYWQLCCRHYLNSSSKVIELGEHHTCHNHTPSLISPDSQQSSRHRPAENCRSLSLDNFSRRFLAD